METKQIKESAIERGLTVVVKITGAISAFFLFCLMSLIFIDVFCRYFFNRPIIGGTELVEFLMALMVGLSLAYGQYLKRHVFVEIFYQKLKGRLKTVVDIVVYLFCFGIYLLIAYAAFQQAEYLMTVKMTSQVLLIPAWPFRLVLSVGAFIYCLAIVRDIIWKIRTFGREDQDAGEAAPDVNSAI